MPKTLTPVVDKLPDLRCPLLGLFGAEDKHPSPDATRELARILTEHGKTFDFHTYEHAGHGFFAVDRPSYRPEAANDGWRRIFAWFRKHLES
jgi:carboxymethylenebutenolidase